MQDDTISAGYILYMDKANQESKFRLRYREDYTKSELEGRNKEIKSIVVNPNFEFVFNYKQKGKKPVKLVEGTYNIIKLNTMGIKENDMEGIKRVTVNTIITNKFFLNKINNLCHSNNYQQLLRRKGKNTTINEDKLIKYMINTSSTWVEELINFEINVDSEDKNEILYPGIRFLLEDNFTLDMLKDYKHNKMIEGTNYVLPVDSPFGVYSIGYDGSIIEVDGEIKKYDLWKWGEDYEVSPIIVKKCLKKNNLPSGKGAKLLIIKTNSYEPLYTSDINKDYYSTTTCPYGQMIDSNGEPTNPNNLEYCKLLSSDINIKSKKTTPSVWKTREISNFKLEVSLYHPKFNNEKYYYVDPKNNIYYFPVGSVWRATKSITPPDSKVYYPSIDNSCSLNTKMGPQKETILVSGDVALPINYELIWNSAEMVTKLFGEEKKVGAYIFSSTEGNGDKVDLKNGSYTKSTLPVVEFSPKSISILDNYKLTINTTMLDYKSVDVLEPGITNTGDGFDLPSICQFNLDPVEGSTNKFNYMSFSNMSNTAIHCYGINSETSNTNNPLFRYLTSDLVNSNPTITPAYTNFTGGSPSVVYFPNDYNLEKQRILQGYSTDLDMAISSNNSSNASNTNNIMAPVFICSTSGFSGDVKPLINTHYEEKQLIDIGMYRKIQSLVVIPGYEIEVVGQVDIAQKNKAPITSREECEKAGGTNYAYECGGHYCCGPCNGIRECHNKEYWFCACTALNTYTENQMITRTIPSGVYPILPMDLSTIMSIKIKRTEGVRISVSLFSLWSFIRDDTMEPNTFYIKNPVFDFYLSTTQVSTSTFASRNNKNNNLGKNISIVNDRTLEGTKFELIQLKNGKFYIKNANMYLTCKGNGAGIQYSFSEISDYWNSITSMTLDYYPPLNVIMKGSNNKYCKDNGKNLNVTCNTNKNGITDNEKIVIEYQSDSSGDVIYFKGNTSGMYAAIKNNSGSHLMFSEMNKTGLNTKFKFYQNNVDSTYQIYKQLTDNFEPVKVQIKTFSGKEIGIDDNGNILYIDNYSFTLKKLETSTQLQPAGYGNVSIWRPIPPQGYVALGDLVTRNNNTKNNKPTPPQIYTLKPGGLMHELNDNKGPELVCVPIDCTERISAEPAWNNNGASVKIYDNSNQYNSQIPNITVIPKPIYLWTSGIGKNVREDNIYRPLQSFNSDGGYNLLRASTGKIAPISNNDSSYKLLDSCLTVVKPTPIPLPIEDSLSILKDRNESHKFSYFTEPQNAYIERNIQKDDMKKYHDNKPKSYYVKYLKKDIPNKEQKEHLLSGENPQGNPLFQIRTENPNKKDFTYCLEVEGDKLKSTDCILENRDQWWRIKDNNNSNDNELDLNSESINKKPINIMSASNKLKEPMCFMQGYNEEGVNSETLINCSYKDPLDFKWKYKSLKLADLSE